MTWQSKFDRLLKAMAHGEPPKSAKQKAEERQERDSSKDK